MEWGQGDFPIAKCFWTTETTIAINNLFAKDGMVQ
jgi:hypothetical protein